MKKIYFLLTLLIIFGLLVLYSRQMKKTTPTEGNQTIPTQSVTINQSGATQTTETPANISEGLTIEIILPINNSTVNTVSTLVKGKTSSNAEVFVNEKELKADSNGKFSTTVALEEGENYILVSANDEQGNYAEKEVMVNLETVE